MTTTNRWTLMGTVAALALVLGITGGHVQPHDLDSVQAAGNSRIQSAELQCGNVSDDSTGSFSWIDLDDVESEFDVELPSSVPSGYAVHQEAQVEVDASGDGWRVSVFYLPIVSVGEEGVVVEYANHDFYSSPFVGDPPYDPLDNLSNSGSDSEIGWESESGYVFLISSDAGVGADDLEGMACTIAGYSGDPPPPTVPR